MKVMKHSKPHTQTIYKRAPGWDKQKKITSFFFFSHLKHIFWIQPGTQAKPGWHNLEQTRGAATLGGRITAVSTLGHRYMSAAYISLIILWWSSIWNSFSWWSHVHWTSDCSVIPWSFRSAALGVHMEDHTTMVRRSNEAGSTGFDKTRSKLGSAHHRGTVFTAHI